MSWINLQAYQEYFPESGQVRINHCKSGEANRKFYLTRQETGEVVGYCHHCGGRGVHKASYSEMRQLKPDKTYKGECAFQKWKVPRLDLWDSDERWQQVPFEDLPLLTRRWWFKSGLNVSEYEMAGIKMLDGNKFTIPLYCEGNLTGLAIRPMKDTLPKWLMLGSKNVSPFTQTNPGNDTLILTEDYLSALRLSRYYSTLPLLGISLNDKVFSLITKWNKAGRKVVIWLDNDSLQVKQNAKQIYKKLEQFVKCGIVLIEKEPKHFLHDHEMREVIHGKSSY